MKTSKSKVGEKKKVWVVLDGRGRILNDMRGRIGFTTKKRGREVAEMWKGKLAEAVITVKALVN